MGQLIDFVLHIDKYLGDFIQQYGTLTYIILLSSFSVKLA